MYLLISNMIDSVFRTGKNYYPQVFLEECTYVIYEKICLNILLTIKKFLLLKKIPMKKILIRNVLQKILIKLLMKKIKSKNKISSF